MAEKKKAVSSPEIKIADPSVVTKPAAPVVTAVKGKFSEKATRGTLDKR